MTDLDKEALDEHITNIPDEEEYDEDPDEQYDNGDEAYDAMMDEIVGDYFDRLRDRQELYKKLLLCDYHGNHNEERDNLEKELLINITGTDRDWKEDAGRHKDE